MPTSKKSIIFIIFLLAMLAVVSGCAFRTVGIPSSQIRTDKNYVPNVEKHIDDGLSQNNEMEPKQEILTALENAVVEGKGATPLCDLFFASTTREIGNLVDYGIICGNMNYINPLYEKVQTCAENTETKEKYCVKKYKIVKTGETTQKRKYELKVPAGLYIVYSEDTDGRRGYYSELAVCGLRVECPSNEIIVVDIKPGEIKTDINPLDWDEERERRKER